MQTKSSSDEQASIEDTIVKLVQHSKKKVSVKEFTAIDRMNLIDLFVNNERTYNYIYKSLFDTTLLAEARPEKPDESKKQESIGEMAYFLTEVLDTVDHHSKSSKKSPAAKSVPKQKALEVKGEAGELFSRHLSDKLLS